MKVRALFLAFALALAVSTSAFASQWGTPTHISNLRIASDYEPDAWYFDGTGGGICGSNTYRLHTSTPGFQQIFSVLLSAQLAGKPVQIWIINCTGSYSNVYGVALQ